MPVAAEDRLEVGVLGLEAVHQWEHDLDVLGDPLRLHDPGAWPKYRVREIGGLHSGPERESSGMPLVGKIGVGSRPTKINGKTVTYSGTVYGRTLAEVRLGRLMLLTAFSVQTPRTMRVIPDDDYAGGTEHVFTAVPIGCDCDDVQSRSPTAQPSPFAREFVISLRMDDPRTYLPDAVEVSGSTVAIAGGYAPTDFIATIGSPSADLTITGARGILRVTGLSGSSTATIDTVRGEVLQGGVPAGKIHASTTLLDAPGVLPPGDSTLTLTGAPSMTVTYRKAFW